jgi:hypothetical protein
LQDYTNRDLADIVLFARNGLISVEQCKYGPPGATLTIDRAYLTALLEYNRFPPLYQRFRDHKYRSNFFCKPPITPTSRAGGDLSGFYPDPSVAAINGVSIPPAPSANDVLVALSPNSAVWEQITDAQISALAAIQGTKIDPDFGAQPIVGASLSLGSPLGPIITYGAGEPTSIVANGSLYLRTDGDAATTLYIFQSGVWSTIDGGGSGGELVGDVDGPSNANIVEGIQTNPVAATPPIEGAVLVYDAPLGQYDVRKLTLDDLAPVFTITSFNGGSTVECGVIVTNPTFTASYTSLPSSVVITNSDSISSPLSLITPFNSVTVTGAFSHSTLNSATTFTLTAMLGSNMTSANAYISFLGRSFGGVGTAGATGGSASGNNLTLSGASGTLNDLGLHASDIGQAYGPFSPTAQKIYLVLPHTQNPHTFKDQYSFAFPVNPPTTFTFTNQNNAGIMMDIYESVLNLSTSFTITVAS